MQNYPFPFSRESYHLWKCQEEFTVQWLFEDFRTPVTEGNSISMHRGGKQKGGYGLACLLYKVQTKYHQILTETAVECLSGV